MRVRGNDYFLTLKVTFRVLRARPSDILTKDVQLSEVNCVCARVVTTTVSSSDSRTLVYYIKPCMLDLK